MLSVLFRKQCLICWNTPVYIKTIIYNTYSSVCLRMIELVAFILKNCRFT